MKNAPPFKVSWLALSFMASSLLILSAGCAVKGPDKLPGITENVNQPDIPVPRKFKPRYRWSYDEFANTPGHFRSWQGEYIGTTNPREIVSWYLDQMPLDGWQHKSSYAGSKRVLVYTKGTEEIAVLTIYKEFDSNADEYKTIVRAEIRPTPPHELSLEDVLPDRAKRPLPTTEAEAVPASASETETQDEPAPASHD